MEMVLSGFASMYIGYLAGRAMKLSDVQTIVVITMCGMGACFTGLAYLWIGDVITGQSGNPCWLFTGALGCIPGILVYRLSLYFPWLVQFGKNNGLL
jgi:uncharacterized membrane protein HdeD (DUF308 family)